MVFEWDGKKSLANEAKHGVGLDFGCYLWDGRVVTLRSPKKGEDRRLSIGLIGANTGSRFGSPAVIQGG